MAVEGRSKGETESEIIPAHQVLQIKYHGTKILQTETDSKCRLCKQTNFVHRSDRLKFT
jgi:hypothetical protein